MGDIEKLPDRVLALILGFCSKSDHDTLKLVSPKWNKIITKYHGGEIIMVTGLKSGTHTQKIKSINSRMILRGQYMQAVEKLKYIAEMDSTLKKKNSTKVQRKGSKGAGDAKGTRESFEELIHHQHIHKLCFVGHIPLRTLSVIMNSCKYLHGIHLHMSSLSRISKDTQLELDIPTLHTFGIDTLGVKEEWRLSGENPNSFLDWDSAFDVTVDLLRINNFANLKSLIINAPFCAEKEKQVYSVLSNFLMRHAKSIQSFCFHQGFEISLKGNKDVEDEDEKMDTDEDTDGISLASLAKSAVELKQLSLVDIHYRLYCPQESDALWKNDIIHQNRMKTLVFTGNGSKINLPTGTIKANSKYLVTLILEVRDNVDLATFTECSLLKTLSLIGSPPNPDYDDPTKANIRNSGNLPLSLENLTFHHLRIHRQAADEILCNPKWNNLKNIDLINCGNEGNMGVSIQTVTKIWDQKRLHHFCLKGSLNRKSFSEKTLPGYLQLFANGIINNSLVEYNIENFLDEYGQYHPDIDAELLDLGQPDVFAFPEQLDPVGARADDWDDLISDSDTESESGEEDEEEEDDEYEDMSDSEEE